VRGYLSPSTLVGLSASVRTLGRDGGAPRAAPVGEDHRVRVTIRVKPGSSRTVVGGRYGAGPAAPLVVSVTAAAVDGAATEAALSALADALGLRRRDLRLVRGRTAREKVVELLAVPPGTDAVLARLRGE